MNSNSQTSIWRGFFNKKTMTNFFPTCKKCWGFWILSIEQKNKFFSVFYLQELQANYNEIESHIYFFIKSSTTNIYSNELTLASNFKNSIKKIIVNYPFLLGFK